MIMSDEDDDGSREENGDSEDDAGNGDSDDEVDLAVDIIESIQLGTGARITCLTAWCAEEGEGDEVLPEPEVEEPSLVKNTVADEEEEKPKADDPSLKRKLSGHDVTMDEAAVKKARSLVEKAKTLKQKKEKKKKKKKATH